MVAALLFLLLQFSRIQSTILPREFIATRDDTAHIDPADLVSGDSTDVEVIFLDHNYEDGPKTASVPNPVPKTQI
jgi:hypothetical protein